jgi:hypothetical protein
MLAGMGRRVALSVGSENLTNKQPSEDSCNSRSAMLDHAWIPPL